MRRGCPKASSYRRTYDSAYLSTYDSRLLPAYALKTCDQTNNACLLSLSLSLFISLSLPPSLPLSLSHTHTQHTHTHTNMYDVAWLPIQGTYKLFTPDNQECRVLLMFQMKCQDVPGSVGKYFRKTLFSFLSSKYFAVLSSTSLRRASYTTRLRPHTLAA
jgi:hypothetical protein